MAAALRSSVPQPIRRLAREIRHRRSASAPGGAARLAARRILHPDSLDASRHELAVAEDLEAVERLFADSERNFADIVAPYVSEFRWSLGEVYNDFVESVDAELYYSVVRRHRPRLIIEVGSGDSTSFAQDATTANGVGHIVSIDPETRRALPQGVEHLASRVEDVDPALFGELGADDVLFIDSSHTTQEANFHTEGILARLIGSYRWHRARVPGLLWTTRLHGDPP